MIKAMSVRFSMFILATMTFVANAFVFAHEGHKAISTKGVRIENGKLLLDPSAMKAIGLKTATVDFGDIAQNLTVNASVSFWSMSRGFASSSITGTIQSIRVKPGEIVHKNTILAEIQSLELENLQLDLIQAATELKLAEQNLERAKRLGSRIVAGKNVWELETQISDRKIVFKTAQQKLEAIGLKSKQIEKILDLQQPIQTLSIVAPLSGMISHIDVNIGQSVQPSEHLFEIVDNGEVWIKGDVPEDWVAQVTPGQEVRMTFSALPDLFFTGTIAEVGKALDFERHVLPVWVRVKNPNLMLKSGMFGLMRMTLSKTLGAFVAPLSGIVEEGAQRYAFVQEAIGVYVKRNVVIGKKDGPMAEIVDGLYPGDTIVTEGSHELSVLFVQGSLDLSLEAQKSIGLEVTTLVMKPIPEIVKISASILPRPDRSASVSMRIDGKIDRIYVTPGQWVKKGTPLAEIYSLAFENLQIDLLQAVLQRDLMNRQLVQMEQAIGVSSNKEVQRLKGQIDILQNLIASLKRKLFVMGLTDETIDNVLASQELLHTLSVIAPISGHMTEINGMMGQVVQAQDVLFKMVDASFLLAEGRLFESDFAKVRDIPKEIEVHVMAYREKIYTGTVLSIGQRLSESEHVLPIWVEIANPDLRLMPNMQADIFIPTGQASEPVLAIPLTAILHIAGQDYAFVNVDHSWKRVAVEIGRKGLHDAEIKRGLVLGDRVAVSGVNDLNTAMMSLK